MSESQQAKDDSDVSERVEEPDCVEQVLSCLEDSFPVLIDNSGTWIDLDTGWAYVGQTLVAKLHFVDSTSACQLNSEQVFCDYLFEQQVAVARPVKARSGEWTVRLKTDKHEYFVTCFQKALGLVAGHKHATPELFSRMGQELAKLHLAANKFEADSDFQRPKWNEFSHIHNRHELLKGGDPELLVKIEQLCEFMSDKYDSGHDCGLVHGDFHNMNFHWQPEQQQLTLFDFSDCHFSCFAMDIAFVLFYFRRFMKSEDLSPSGSNLNVKEQAFAQHFFNNFIRGYESLRPSPIKTEDELVNFILWRSVDLLLYVKQLKFVATTNGEDYSAYEQSYSNVILNELCPRVTIANRH